MAELLQPGGTLYLSTPIGIERVEFNANWVFDPRSIMRFAEGAGMTLGELYLITSEHVQQVLAFDDSTLANIASQPYQLGLFIFTKN